MAKNLRALTPEEFKYLNDKYIFEFIGGYIVTHTRGFERKVLHSPEKSFTILTPIRRVNITKEAIDLWLNEFHTKYTLLEIQNAISILTVTYQEVNKEEIEKQILRGDAKIKLN